MSLSFAKFFFAAGREVCTALLTVVRPFFYRVLLAASQRIPSRANSLSHASLPSSPQLCGLSLLLGNTKFWALIRVLPSGVIFFESGLPLLYIRCGRGFRQRFRRLTARIT